MGVYLSTPKTEKEITFGENEKLYYAAASMQGWRTSMEDAHLTHLDIDENLSLFGVFDGHGGKEVAHFVSRHLSETLKSRSTYSTDLGAALQESFLNLDEQMRAKEGRKELRDILHPAAPVPATGDTQDGAAVAAPKKGKEFVERLIDLIQESNKGPEQNKEEKNDDNEDEDDEGPGFNS